MGLVVAAKRTVLIAGTVILVVPLFLTPLILISPPKVYAATDTFNSSTTWTAPAGVTSVIVEAWGGGGGGGAGSSGRGGGGGGAYSSSTVSVTSGNNYTVTVGGGGGEGSDGGDSWFSTSGTVMAKGGTAGADNNGSAGGAAGSGVGTTKFSGGTGGNISSNGRGGGGGGGNGAASANGAAGRIILTYPLISVSVSDGTVAYGILATNTSKDTTSGGLNDTQSATNGGTAAEDFNIAGQNSANWTLAATPGSNQYSHQYCKTGGGSPDPCDASPTWTSLSTSYQQLAANVSASSNQRFDLKINTPTSTSATSQQTVNITIQAVQH